MNTAVSTRPSIRSDGSTIKPRPSLADRIMVEEVMYLLIAPALHETDKIHFTIRQADPEDDPKLNFTPDLSRACGHLDDILLVGHELADFQRFDWCLDKTSFTVPGRMQSLSSHDRIEMHQRLAAIAIANGADWTKLSKLYADIQHSSP